MLWTPAEAEERGRLAEEGESERLREHARAWFDFVRNIFAASLIAGAVGGSDLVSAAGASISKVVVIVLLVVALTLLGVGLGLLGRAAFGRPGGDLVSYDALGYSHWYARERRRVRASLRRGLLLCLLAVVLFAAALVVSWSGLVGQSSDDSVKAVFYEADDGSYEICAELQIFATDATAVDLQNTDPKALMLPADSPISLVERCPILAD